MHLGSQGIGSQVASPELIYVSGGVYGIVAWTFCKLYAVYGALKRIQDRPQKRGSCARIEAEGDKIELGEICPV